MNSYLWITGSIQADCTRQESKGRQILLTLALIAIVVVVAAAVMRGKSTPTAFAAPPTARLAR